MGQRKLFYSIVATRIPLLGWISRARLLYNETCSYAPSQFTISFPFSFLSSVFVIVCV